ncbi:MAG: ice-binding family protein [Clostridiaceae bacterium]
MKNRTNNKLLSLLLATSIFVTMAAPRLAMAAEDAVEVGTTSNFAILAGETVTNTGTTEITGDVGLYAGSAFPGAPDVILNGAIHLSDTVAQIAKDDLVTAYDDLAGRTPQLINRELGGQTLLPGVYVSESKDFQLTGKLTLDGQGDPNAIFIFQTDTTLITASASSVELIGGAIKCGVFWKVGSSATLGSNSNFAGRIFALTSITLQTGAEIQGQLLARNGSVTLDSNKINGDACAEEEFATLHLIKKVVNADGVTAVAGDFNISVLKDGINVEGSPNVGMDTPGRPYTLAAGNYTVTEANAEGYTISYSGDSTDGKITLNAGDAKTITITNTAAYGVIALEKLDEKGNLLSGAEFTLYKNDIQVGEPLVTDENGKLTLTGLPLGSYTLKETKAPEGYVLSDVIEKIDIVKANETVEISFTNTRIMGQINITKVDKDTDKVLAGAGFIITDNAGTKVFEGKTNDAGLLSTSLPYGKYIVEEVTAPTNYSKSEEKYSVEITKNGQVFNLEVENTKTADKIIAPTKDTLPKAGSTTDAIFLFIGGIAIIGGILLMRNRPKQA